VTLNRPIVATLVALAAAVAVLHAGESRAGDGRFRVLHAEPVVLEGLGARPSRASFEAYGRRFDLALESNARLLAGVDPVERAAMSGMQVLRGTVQGLPGSWVRLTIDGDRQSGMVWDGRDLYVIEPADDVAPRSVNPLGASGRKPVVYRLSDTQADLGAGTCTAVTPDGPPGQASGLDEYRVLVGELTQAAEATGLSGRLLVSALADYEYLQVAGSVESARNRIVAILNNVDGIFSAQVGIQIELSDGVTVFQDPADPFSTSIGKDLLTELAAYRESQPSLRSTGVTHLVTGRDLDGSTVGIAFIGSICLARFGASISQGVSTLTSLVAAHEIGHNFGAPHDGETADPGEPVNPCASTPRTFLMAPQINGSDQFSQCSLTQIEPRVRAASCILPIVTSADVALATETGTISVTSGQVFGLAASVSSRGPAEATSVQLTFTLPNGLSVIDGTATNGGSCASQAGGIACNWPLLGADITSAVTVNLRADAAGSYVVSAALSAAQDASNGNDVLSYQVTATAPAPIPPPPPPPAPSKSGGGGGSTGGGALSLLLALLAVRRDRAGRGFIANAR
jgi:uncharacterized repeat protein (TIGR01451 family)